MTDLLGTVAKLWRGKHPRPERFSGSWSPPHLAPAFLQKLMTRRTESEVTPEFCGYKVTTVPQSQPKPHRFKKRKRTR